MQKLLTLCKKIAESLVLSTIRRIFVVRKRRRKLSKKVVLLQYLLALSMLKLPLRATLPPIRLAPSGIFYRFAAKYSSIIQRELTMEDLFH